MRFLSVCSGIEAASVAWNPLGWKAAAFAEIEKFPSAVLAHHYPDTPNLGDMTKFQEWPDLGSIDVLCGGTPCQSFSVAGLRKGLADPRGNLMLTFGAIAAKHWPRWLVWENVPGVLSSEGGRDFGAFLGLLGELGYGFAYRVLDAQYAGLAQRRKRVFVVGCFGDWRSAAAVLFERHSLSGHPAPSRQARKDAAGSTGDGLARCVTTGEAKRQDFETCALVASTLQRHHGNPQLDQTLVAFDTTQMTSAANRSVPKAGDPCHPLAAGAHAPAICFSAKDYGADAGDISPTLRAGGHTSSHANAGVMPAIAFDARQSDVLQYGEKTGPLDTDGSSIGLHVGMQVRRLTPRECERLQGFPDDYTLIPFRGKPAADGPRYKALGNSWAVPCARWIGERISAVEAIRASRLSPEAWRSDNKTSVLMEQKEPA